MIFDDCGVVECAHQGSTVFEFLEQSLVVDVETERRGCRAKCFRYQIVYSGASPRRSISRGRNQQEKRYQLCISGRLRTFCVVGQHERIPDRLREKCLALGEEQIQKSVTERL
jgi:hypothetical protein